ncbi:MAG: ABC transporter permease, partial [Oscillospiraceae bacterium]
SFNAEPKSIVHALVYYAVIFLLILINSLRQIHLSNPIELMKSENSGEKPPKANFVLAVMGAVLLAAAYFMAVYIKEPMSALLAFFIAVLMVIAATYLLFIAGSVAVCRVLQKNKRYYYKTNHFISVSQMTYRMKRNGAGLASICILSTMVLVTLSSTICLFIGEEDMLRERYPRDFVIETYPYSTDDEMVSHMHDTANSAVKKLGETPVNVLKFGYFRSREAFSDSTASSFKTTDDSEAMLMDIRYLVMISLDDYNRVMGESVVLSDGEALMYTTYSPYNFDTLTIDDFASFSIKSRVDDFPNVLPSSAPAVYLFVNGRSMIDKMYELRTKAGDCCFQPEIVDYYAFDLGCDSDKKIEVLEEICTLFAEESGDSPENSVGYSISCFEDDRADFIAVYGGLFFLGILFGTVFIAAAVLIMYYKQISEGFEDKTKFSILQKVGMTKDEIRKSINSQVLTVFFAPLAAAGVHMAFAFGIISRLLLLFGLTDVGLFAVVTLCCFLLFGLLHTVVYLITSGSYYKIVSGRE